MDIWEFAINMELDGEKYYNEQAAKNQGNGLNAVFLMLAKDERDHANILTGISKGLPFKSSEPVNSVIKNIFNEMADFRSEIKEIPAQLDVYRTALEMEKQSIDLYKKLLYEASHDKVLFEYLIKQEEAHYEIVEEIVKMVSRPDEWVESAEFGDREEY